MSIDSRVINAAVYANIVHQADVEISIRKEAHDNIGITYML